MANFVLVHGGWHGGWCWKLVVPHLRAAGHDVYTPTLTGLGERAHLYSDELALATHVEDVAAVLRFRDLDNVVLVGHSYAGMVITGVAETEHARIRRLVYLDAVVPSDGQTFFDALGPEFARAVEAMADETGRVEAPMAQFFGVTDPDLVPWVEAKLTPHPISTAHQPLALSSPEAEALARTYILCPGGAYGGHYRVAKANGWETRKLVTGHDAMITAPAELAALLLEAADA